MSYPKLRCFTDEIGNAWVPLLSQESQLKRIRKPELYKLSFAPISGLLSWLFKEGSKSVQVLLNGTETRVALTLRILKWRAPI